MSLPALAGAFSLTNLGYGVISCGRNYTISRKTTRMRTSYSTMEISASCAPWPFYVSESQAIVTTCALTDTMATFQGSSATSWSRATSYHSRYTSVFQAIKCCSLTDCTSSIQIAFSVYDFWSTRRRAERAFSLLSKIVPLILAGITIGLLQTPAVQSSFLVYMVVANVQGQSVSHKLY